MLTAAQFDRLMIPITELYEEFQTSVIVDIARRLGNLDFDSAAWQVQRLSESGAVYEQIITRLSQLTGQSEAVLRETFQSAGVRAMRFDDAIYRAAGLNPVPLNLSPAMLSVLRAGLSKTNGVLRNLTMTTATTGQNAFIQASDLAYMQISTGTMSYQQAVREAVINTSRQGLSVINYASGKQDQLDVAVRRTVLTGVGQTTGELQITRMDEMGTVLVQTSAHIGARNTGTGPANHEGWQGKVFSRSPLNTQYPDFVQSTGYGSGEGLNGWNCRHSFFPFFEDISENAYSEAQVKEYADKTVTYNGKEMSFYDATQYQRGIERKIRKLKRDKAALEAAGLPYDTELQKIQYQQARMRDFLNQTGLKRQSFREQV
jgi:hypothetical protein